MRQKPIRWLPKHVDAVLRRQSLWWLIRVARDFGIIGASLEVDLTWLRKERNNVHIQQRAAIGATAYLNQSKKAFELVNRSIEATKVWRGAHP